MILAASQVIELTWVDLGISAVLVLLAGGVSVALRLGLEKRLALAGVRTVVQLLIIGYVLQFIFRPGNGWLLAPLILVMIAAATRQAIRGPKRSVRGLGLLAFSALAVSSLVTLAVVTQAIVGVQPWYKPQYVIPLLGMILGNTMTGISLCVDQVLEILAERRDEVEMELALGATRWEAARGPLSDAVRRGMIPIINKMMVVGLVSLPGMMTGQILGGTDPLQAVRYQIMVMFMIAAATSLGCIAIALLIYRRMFTPHHQLRGGVIRRRGK